MSNKEVVQTSSINLSIGLNDEKVPVRIDWAATDNPQGEQTAKAMLLSIFDEESKETLKIDLWTTDMQVNEMDQFFFMTLRGLADTYYKATQNKEVASEMKGFCQYFGEKTGLIKKEE